MVPAFQATALPPDLRAASVFLNLDGDYSYLGDGYYRSMQAEHEGLAAIPTCQEALDAYVVPLALAKAEAAGIPVPPWEIANDTVVSFRPPILAYPINPFQDEGQLITEPSEMGEAIKSLTMTSKYALVCQQIPPDARVDTLRLVLGRRLKPEYREFAEKLWTTFRVPLAKVKVIVTETQYLFSALQPLAKEQLTQNEKALLKEAGVWRE